MHLLNPLEEDKSKLSEIFEKIYEKNAVAFLGAGASVTNKKFLSKEFIDLYEGKISKQFGTTDIIKFVDILQGTEGLRRSDFDNFIVKQLSKLEPNSGHMTFVTIPWKQIVTTNYDTLVEQASEKAIKEGITHYQLRVIRSRKQIDYYAANNEISYIKLNGCKTDLAEYPLVFSTEDFKRQQPFYNRVLSNFKTYTNDIIYIAFGYSFTDIFAERLFEKIDQTDFRQKRIFYSVDPFVNENTLDYLKGKNIAVIKMSFEEFFEEYEKWYESNHKNYLKNLQKFTNPDNSNIKINTSSRLYLDGSIIQFKEDYKSNNKLRKQEFYFGAEPNYQVVNDDYDVVKTKGLGQILDVMSNSFTGTHDTNIPKLILVSGDFGSGKTTFTLRAIKEFLKKDNSALAFEVTKSLGLKKGYLAQLIKDSSATKFIFYTDNIETDSVFKSFNDIRIELATEQYSNIGIIFISSIRQNILERYKNTVKLSIKNHEVFDYDSRYTDGELGLLVDNLKEVGLIDYRDLVEKNSLIHELKLNYNGDSFMTLYKLIQNGTHYKLLEKAYEELTSDIKLAFKITALIHRFNMNCPASLVLNAIKTMDWNQFTEHVLRGDGKGILFQEKNSTTNSDPDLFFKTKHPVIAQALVETIIRNTEKNSLYKSIFSGLKYSEYFAWFIVDLIKNIRFNDNDITEGQIDNYFDLAKKEFSASPHFMIAYVSNIERKSSSIEQLESCLHDITMLESTLEFRNHRLIHRKGCVCFRIAKLMFKNKHPIDDVNEYLNSAEEWFIIKKRIDSTTHYSYADYLKLLLWKMDNLKLDGDELIDLHLKINNLFDEAYRTLANDTDLINDYFEQYSTKINRFNDESEYYELLLDKYQNVNKRPLACILLYYYFDEKNNTKKCQEFVDEMTSYMDNKDVVYFLFKYFGRNLHYANNRIKFFEIVRYNSFLKERYPMRYYYFTSVCEFYDWKWQRGKELLNEMKANKQNGLNPDFFLYWLTDYGEPEIFEAEIVVEKKFKSVKITNPFFKQFMLQSGNYDKYSAGDRVEVKLRFFFEGIRAEIVKN